MVLRKKPYLIYRKNSAKSNVLRNKYNYRKKSAKIECAKTRDKSKCAQIGI